MKVTLPFFNFETNAAIGALLVALIVVVLLLAYLFACLVLYCFVKLTGLLEFSWLNGFYTLVLMIAAMVCFKGESK